MRSVCTRDDLTAADAVDWLDPALRVLANPPVAEVTNMLRTLRALYVLADQGVRVGPAKNLTQLPHRELLKTKLVDVFRIVTPYWF